MSGPETSTKEEHFLYQSNCYHLFKTILWLQLIIIMTNLSSFYLIAAFVLLNLTCLLRALLNEMKNNF